MRRRKLADTSMPAPSSSRLLHRPIKDIFISSITAEYVSGRAERTPLWVQGLGRSGGLAYGIHSQGAGG